MTASEKRACRITSTHSTVSELLLKLLTHLLYLVSDNLGGIVEVANHDVDDISPRFNPQNMGSGKGRGGEDDDVSISLTQYYLKGSV